MHGKMRWFHGMQPGSRSAHTNTAQPPRAHCARGGGESVVVVMMMVMMAVDSTTIFLALLLGSSMLTFAYSLTSLAR